MARTARKMQQEREAADRAGPTGASEPAARPVKETGGPDFTIITGLSGAGRSEAARCLEDLGYFVVDNLPPALIGKMAELAAASGSPPKRRSRVVKSRTASRSASGPNSGHISGVNSSSA